RPDRLDVDGRADAARGRRRATRLVDLESGHAFGCQVGEVERATGECAVFTVATGSHHDHVRGRHLPAVEGDEIEAGSESARRHARAFTAYAIDGNTSDALE